MPTNAKCCSDYFAIEDILITQERVPCTFLQTVPKLGKLNPIEEDSDLKSGTNLEIPMWLAMDISTSNQPVINPDLPKFYKEAYCEIFKADPCAVALHKFGLYFYDLGLYAKNFDSKGNVVDILLQTFTERFRLLMDLTENINLNPTVVHKLDTLEKNLFKSAHEARLKLIAWLMMSEKPIEAASMVVNHKKRKRVDNELF